MAHLKSGPGAGNNTEPTAGAATAQTAVDANVPTAVDGTVHAVVAVIVWIPGGVLLPLLFRYVLVFVGIGCCACAPLLLYCLVSPTAFLRLCKWVSIAYFSAC